MKRILKWFLGILSSALTITLVIVLFPHISRIVSRLLPDESASAIRASVILSQEFTQRATLETLRIKEEGALNYEVKAAFLGTVASITADYTYEGSFGIDLQQVTMRREGGTLVLVLPEPTLILDTLTPSDITLDKTLYPYLDENDYQRVLEEQRLACREGYLSGDKAQMLWDATTAALDETIARWLDASGGLSIRYEKAD